MRRVGGKESRELQAANLANQHRTNAALLPTTASLVPEMPEGRYDFEMPNRLW